MIYQPLARSGWIAWVQEFETSLGSMAKPRLYEKNKSEVGVVACNGSPSYFGG